MRSKLVLTGAIAMLLLALTAASSTAQGADVVPPLPEGYTAPVPAEAGPEASLTGIATVTTGLYHSCAVTSSHQVRCWGSDGTGALGDGDAVPSTGAVTVRNATNSGPLTNVTQVVLGSYHSCALLATHQVRCWGAGADGQLGNGDVAERHLPVAVKTPPARPTWATSPSWRPTTGPPAPGSSTVRPGAGVSTTSPSSGTAGWPTAACRAPSWR